MPKGKDPANVWERELYASNHVVGYYFTSSAGAAERSMDRTTGLAVRDGSARAQAPTHQPAGTSTYHLSRAKPHSLAFVAEFSWVNLRCRQADVETRPRRLFVRGISPDY